MSRMIPFCEICSAVAEREGGLGRIKERLDKVRALIQEPEFLEGKGLYTTIKCSANANIPPANNAVIYLQ